MTPPFDPTNLRAAVSKTLDAAVIPAHHGFAAIVDTNGAHVALATRVGDGWTLDLSGGYDYAGQEAKGWNGQLSLGKSW